MCIHRPLGSGACIVYTCVHHTHTHVHGMLNLQTNIYSWVHIINVCAYMHASVGRLRVARCIYTQVYTHIQAHKPRDRHMHIHQQARNTYVAHCTCTSICMCAWAIAHGLCVAVHIRAPVAMLLHCEHVMQSCMADVHAPAPHSRSQASQGCMRLDMHMHIAAWRRAMLCIQSARVCVRAACGMVCRGLDRLTG